MRAALNFLSRSGSWFEWYPTGRPLQHPTLWRFLAFGCFRGTVDLGCPSTTVWTQGFGVFDWNATRKRYELTRFSQPPASPAYWGFSGETRASWVSDTKVRIVCSAFDSAYNVTRHAGKLLVSATGVITFSQDVTTACGSDAYADITLYAGGAGTVGFNDNIYYSYIYGGIRGENCWVGRLNDVNQATNTAALRTGLSSNAWGRSLSALGDRAGNGYSAETICASGESVVTVALLSTSDAPFVQQVYSYPGVSDGRGMVRMGKRKLLINDQTSGYDHRVSILYTDSDTTPTTISHGSSAWSAPHPTLDSSNFDYAYHGGSEFSAENCWVSEGKNLGLSIYQYKNTSLPLGVTYQTDYVPCRYESTGPYYISLTNLVTDINGNDLPWAILRDNDLALPPTIYIVGGPDDMAVVYCRRQASVATSEFTVQL